MRQDKSIQFCVTHTATQFSPEWDFSVNGLRSKFKRLKFHCRTLVTCVRKMNYDNGEGI